MGNGIMENGGTGGGGIYIEAGCVMVVEGGNSCRHVM